MSDIGRIGQNMANTIPQATGKTNLKKSSEETQVKDQVSLNQGGNSDAPLKKWTFMHYAAADNNLLRFIKADVNEMEVVGSTENMNLVVQLDEGRNCERYYLIQSDDTSKITSPPLESLGPVNMADPKVLADFIKFGVEKYPAQHYALVIGSHGAGWQGAVDDSSHRDFMSLPDIRKAVEMSGKDIDVLGFDCCLMATTEVAHEMNEAGVGYMVGSQQNEGGTGWNYTPLLTRKTLSEFNVALSKRLNISPRQLAEKIIEHAEKEQYSLPTLSAVDLKMMKGVADATNLFSSQIILTDTPNDVLKDCIRKSEYFSNGLRDQFHFAENVVNNDKISDDKLKTAAKGMMKAIQNAVIAEQHSSRHPNAHGLSAELPTYGGVRTGYKDVDYAKRTLWDEAIDKIYDKIQNAPEQVKQPKAEA